MTPRDLSRRGFLATTGASAAIASTSALGAASSANTNGRLRVGFIGVGGRCQTHVDSAIKLQTGPGTVECVAICDVFGRYLDETGGKIESKTGKAPTRTGDYRDIISDPTIDAVVIATPDHWHATQTIAALKAGKHVYCEKPMTHTVQEALDVYQAWKESGKVMQVGVQSTSLPVWNKLNDDICAGKLGKVMQYQTEMFRNSSMGQWRYYQLTKDMNPSNVDWDTFVGHEQGLAPKQPFDRARFAQWRCYWDFGSGMYTDLFVHRTTSMLKATGLRWPGRVVGGGGIFLELDGREAPDVATVIADFPEGVQGLVTATMCSSNVPIQQAIRGHNGSAVLGTGEDFSGYDFVAERPQVTLDSSIKSERVEVGKVGDTSFAHFENFVGAIKDDKPEQVNCSPELGAAAMVVVKLGAMSYREGKAYHFNRDSMTYGDADASWANHWEEMSARGDKAPHVPGWHAGEKGSKMVPEDYQKLAGPWKDGVDPAKA
ncbi:Inositol 2-dehydrogenase [Botrimarina colliarenosi]|uniref:Inositol 2-dehydrogenase n=1 Tax=Botrimarina colliarenosi TaxID=2528001 RepID=A0A5C6AD96_9BACT|nr:Gfo/Idh/MocA family oxidoreductase [Botrimarina colliarenosi]TWT97934.1 Inositol 2-dehydrogenase [Botrimarina colliarenosi]